MDRYRVAKQVSKVASVCYSKLHYKKESDRCVQFRIRYGSEQVSNIASVGRLI